MQEQFIPIDIHSNKLPDWLVSRRHCIRDWQKQIQIIREKINNAIQDMPAHEGIARLLSGAYINYFHCLKIVEILKETEADTKNVFGRYGSQRMKDWQDIIRLYERDNVYLSEAAQILTRNVQYEVPSIKKQIVKCEQSQVECERKEAELKKQENSARNDFNASCQKLGIKGINIKKELLERCEELPNIHERMAAEFSQILPAVDFYAAFVRFMFGSEQKDGSVPLLRHVIKNGNTTTYEWLYKEKPDKIEMPSVLSKDDGKEVGNGDEIDFGDDAIDFGDVKLETGDIDWGSEGIDIVNNPSSEEINFDISLEESGIQVESAGAEEKVASGPNALSVLDNPSTRTNLVNELLEVEAFLKIRVHEMMSSENDVLGLTQMQNAETLLQMQTTECVESMLVSVENVVGRLTDPTVQHLHNIRHSPKYVDHLTETLKQKLILAEKCVLQQKRSKEKRAQDAKDIRDLKPKLQLIIAKTKELQAQIEGDISKKYKNRPVNIMGGINAL